MKTVRSDSKLSTLVAGAAEYAHDPQRRVRLVRVATNLRDPALKLVISVLLIAASALGFMRIDEHNAALAPQLRPLPLETPLDAYVPLVPAFVFAYLLYYPWMLLPAVALSRREDFRRAFGAFVLLQSIAFVVFLVFPSHMVRPEIASSGVAFDLLQWMYRMDRGWNIFPSLHVAHSALVAMICWTHRRQWFPIIAIGSGLIALSTLLIKQHYLLDVPGGFFLAWLCFRVARLNQRNHAHAAAGTSAVGGSNVEASMRSASNQSSEFSSEREWILRG